MGQASQLIICLGGHLCFVAHTLERIGRAYRVESDAFQLEITSRRVSNLLQVILLGISLAFDQLQT
jgi:hypothetical protein